MKSCKFHSCRFSLLTSSVHLNFVLVLIYIFLFFKWKKHEDIMHIDIHVYSEFILRMTDLISSPVALLQLHFKLYFWLCRFNKMSFFPSDCCCGYICYLMYIVIQFADFTLPLSRFQVSQSTSDSFDAASPSPGEQRSVRWFFTWTLSRLVQLNGREQGNYFLLFPSSSYETDVPKQPLLLLQLLIL